MPRNKTKKSGFLTGLAIYFKDYRLLFHYLNTDGCIYVGLYSN